jgi:hypothetical protein
MSDEPKNSDGKPWRVFAPEASLVRRWTIGGAIIGFAFGAVAMTVGTIVDAQPLTVLQLAFLVVPITAGTLQGAGVGFCLGYVVARLKRPKSSTADD